MTAGRRAVAVNRLAADVDALHNFQHPHVEPMPTIAEYRFVRHFWIGMFARIVAVTLAHDFEGVTRVHRRINLFTVAA